MPAAEFGLAPQAVSTVAISGAAGRASIFSRRPPPENKRSFAPDRWDVGDMCACRGAAVVCDGYLVCR